MLRINKQKAMLLIFPYFKKLKIEIIILLLILFIKYN